MKTLESLTVACAYLLAIAPPAADADTAVGRRGMVATVQPLATEAGVQALAQGGNAIDAAIAAVLTLGVVDGHNSGLGGGCFILIRRGNGELVAIDGRETAPAAASRDMFIRNGQADASLSRTGPLAVGIPGALAAYDKALSLHGKLALSSLLEDAAEIADSGFAIDRVYAGKLKDAAKSLATFPAARQMLLKNDQQAYQEGDTLRLPDLATTYRNVAQHGISWFYHGQFATAVGAWMQDHGGLITADDFARYEAKTRDPVISTYRGYQIVGFPPPSSGGIHVAQILNILENFDLPRLMRNDSVAAYHIIAEAMKLAFADRAHWLGDADFVAVPRRLIDKQYARQLARRIDVNQTTVVPGHGVPPEAESRLFGRHTTHIAAADAEGNWIGITATVNTTFGSKVVVPGTGIVLNNQMDDFSSQPGVPNAFGLIGAEANAVAPGKRPLSSMSPTFVLKDGKPIMSVGAAGGPKIITQVVLAIVNYLDSELSLAQSIARARLHHQWRPDRLFLEPTFSAASTDRLERRGHQIEYLTAGGGVSQAIGVTADGQFVGVSDPRVPGAAASVPQR